MDILSMGGSAILVVVILSQLMELAVVQCVYLTAGVRGTPEASRNPLPAAVHIES